MANEFAVLRVIVDHGGQKRTLHEEVRIYLNGLDWDQNLSSNVWFDSETGAVLRKPAFMDDTNWADTNSGIYSKLTKGGGATYGYTLTTSGSWDNWSLHTLGQHWYLQSRNVNEYVISTKTWAVDQPFLVNWFTHGALDSGQDDSGACIEGGWGTPGNSRVSFRGFPSQRMQIFRDNEKVMESDFTTPARIGERKTRRGAGGDSTQRQFVGWWFEPFDNGILITSTATGGSFHCRFEDLETGDPILPATQFWWWVRKPIGATDNPMVTVQAAPVQYLATPYVISDVVHLEVLPGPGVEPEITVVTGGGRDAASWSLLDADGVTAWNGTDKDLRVKVLLDEPTVGSGALYAVEVYWPAVTVRTEGEEAVDLNELSAREDDEDLGGLSIRSISLSVPEGFAPATATVTISNPSLLDKEMSTENVRTICNRAISLQWGRASLQNYLLDGRAGAPKVNYHWNPEAEELTWEISDQCAALASRFYRSRLMFGGLTLEDAFTRAALSSGIIEADDLDLEASDFTIPITSAAKDDADNLARVGDTPMEWLERLLSTYSSLDSLRFVPEIGGVKLRYRTFYVEA